MSNWHQLKNSLPTNTYNLGEIQSRLKADPERPVKSRANTEKKSYMEKRNELNPLVLDKETVARLDEGQLLAISGGAGDDDGPAGTTCQGGVSCAAGTSCDKGNSC